MFSSYGIVTTFLGDNPVVVLEIKDTLNLPKTSFSMKADLPQREPEMLRHWGKIDIYGRIRKARAGCLTYVLHDGPPYANGAFKAIWGGINPHYS